MSFVPSEHMLDIPESNVARTMKSEKLMLRKGTIKNVAKCLVTNKTAMPSKSQGVIRHSSLEDSDKERFQGFLREMEAYQKKNQKMKESYERLMEEYSKDTQQKFSRL
jgi:hypothetical protein